MESLPRRPKPLTLDIDLRGVLTGLLDSCPDCYNEFVNNVALLADDGALTDEQVEAVLFHLTGKHGQHVH